MEKRKLGRFDISLLVNEVSSHRSLYDKKDPEYKNSTFKKVLWTTIGQKFGLTATAAEIKWITQRDRYRREIKLYNDSIASETGEVYQPKWKLFYFIDTFMDPSSGIPQRQLGSSISYSADNDEAEKVEETDDDANGRHEATPSTDSGQISSPACRVARKLRKRNRSVDDALSVFSSASTAVTNFFNKRNASSSSNQLVSNPRVEHFCNYLKIRLDELPLDVRLKAMRRIEAVMLEIEDNL